MEFPDLSRYPYWAYDTETTGLNYLRDKVFGFSVSTPDGNDYYYDIRENPNAKDWINDQFKRQERNKPVYMANASFDIRMSDYSGISIPKHLARDVIVQACCINEHLPVYNLDNLMKRYLGREKETEIYETCKQYFGGRATRNVQIGRIHKLPSHEVAPYAKTDTNGTLALAEWQYDEIRRQGLHDIVDFETELMPMFIDTEMHGIRVDIDYAEQAIAKLEPILNKMQTKLNKIVGDNLNVNSSDQIKAVFRPVEVEDGKWETHDGVPVGTTPGGGPSINAEILRGMDHPAAELILEIRSLIKTKDTFLGKHVLEHAIDGRVYPNINQSKGEDGGTGTGRLSYTNPALQQIPSRNKEVAAIVKPCFLPDEGQVWVDCDKASFEVRVFAHLVNEPQIIEQYKSDPNTDFHQMVADMTNLVRNATYSGQPNAKQLNLSMIFNSGDGAIAEKMGMDWDWDSFVARDGQRIEYKKPGWEAKRVINQYHEKLPGVKRLMLLAKDTAYKRGYLFTDRGRHLRFPDKRFCYKASGILIQSTAGDINKENWQIINEVLGDEGRLLLNTHDSYSMSMPKDWKPLYKKVKKAIERDRLRVPLVLDWSGAGKNWWDALQGVDNA